MNLAFIFTPFANAEVLGAICKMLNFEVTVIPNESGAVVAVELPEKKIYTDWDISELTGEIFTISESALEEQDLASYKSTSSEENMQTLYSDSDSVRIGEIETETKAEDHKKTTDENTNQAHLVAIEISRVCPIGVVLLQTDLGTDVGYESGISGHLQAYKVLEGEIREAVAPGMLLAICDDYIEQVIFGNISLEDCSGAISSRNMSMARALKVVSRIRRKDR